MAGGGKPGPIGLNVYSRFIEDFFRLIDEGTLARTKTPEPGPLGATARTEPAAPRVVTPTNEPDIERLNLAATARTAAYMLKKAHPTVRFTSGRRSKSEQASAMASNVVTKRKWIEETYIRNPLRSRCQEWVDSHPDKQTKAEIAEGLLAIFDAATDAELGRLSKHLSGQAFDVQPVTTDAEKIKETIRKLPGLDKFLDKEGGLVRWHAQF